MTTDRFDLAVCSGTIVTGQATYRADVGIREGLIRAISEDSLGTRAERVVDARGKLVMPGAIDMHVHFEDQGYLDDLRSLSVAGAFGGLTSIIAYIWGPLDGAMLEGIRKYKQKVPQEALIDFGFHGGLLNRMDRVEEIPQAIEEGVTTFKIMMDYKREGYMVEEDIILAAMEAASRRHCMIMVHAEDGYIIARLENQHVAEQKIGPEYLLPSRPNFAEAESIRRATTLARLSDCPVYVVHLSTAEGLQAIKEAHAEGRPVITETCPQYLLMTDDAMKTHGRLAKIGPPLRREADLEAMWSGLRSGHISSIGSDHGGLYREDKQRQEIIFDVMGGVSGVEVLFPLMFDQFVRRGFPLTRFVQCLSENPARVFGLYPKKGAVQVGSDADLVVVDPGLEWTVSQSLMHWQSDYCIYEGRKVSGRPVVTISRGEVLVQDGRLQTEEPRGRFLHRRPDPKLKMGKPV